MSDYEQEQQNLDPENQDLENQEEGGEHRDDVAPPNTDTLNQEGEEFVVTYGDEEPKSESNDDEFNGQPAPQWVKDLRRETKEGKRRIKELESQLSQNQKPQEVVLGEKPTLESVGWDSEEYETKLAEWHEQKRSHDDQERKKQAEQENATKAWQEKLSNYEVKKNAVKTKVRDFEEAEELARDVLNETQQGILIHGAKNPELIIYHLGKNPEKAKELAGIKDPIQFAFAAANIDAQIKVQTRKPQTNPESKVTGSGTLSGATDSTLNKLRAEAEKTGDYTKVVAYKKQKRQKD
ncbi:hypothetical protein ACG94V_21110 [Acinetobacter sp. ULE_I001]|uniref:hypothetical protein n=1 Tax=unclassified Acinetobacter TaxID=196816 RepID=UPI003AF907D1